MLLDARDLLAVHLGANAFSFSFFFTDETFIPCPLGPDERGRDEQAGDGVGVHDGLDIRSVRYPRRRARARR